MTVKKQKYPVIQHARICHACCFGLNRGWKKIQFQLALNKTFCPTPQPLTHRRGTDKEQKLTNQCFPPLPHMFSRQSSQYQIWKANKYSFLTVIELGPPVMLSSLGCQSFMTPLITNKSLIKRKLKIGYPKNSIWDRLYGEPAVITTTLCSAANGENRKVFFTHP